MVIDVIVITNDCEVTIKNGILQSHNKGIFRPNNTIQMGSGYLNPCHKSLYKATMKVRCHKRFDIACRSFHHR